VIRIETARLLLGIALASLCAIAAASADEPAAAAAALRERFATLQGQLDRNEFRRPLVLRSGETADLVSGDVHALIDTPFDAASTALATPADWCDILLLHINTKMCRASTGAGGPLLTLRIGTKHDQPVEEATRMEFSYQVASRSAAFLRVRLGSAEGPMGTRNYRITLEAIPLEGGKTFIHLAYSHVYDLLGRLAMGTYLATTGRDKTGFTVAGGFRGVMERNTMRYYLAIEAFLGALSSPPRARFEKRIHDWFAASERYPRQLHEIGQSEYLEMKRAENLRQSADPA
jgi:hypothetical protein